MALQILPYLLPGSSYKVAKNSTRPTLDEAKAYFIDKKPLSIKGATVAQEVEQLSNNQRVGGSNLGCCVLDKVTLENIEMYGYIHVFICI